MDVALTKITCAGCNIMFWIATTHDERLRASHESFYCPSGCSQSYPGKSDAEKLADLQRKFNDKDKELSFCKSKLSRKGIHRKKTEDKK